MSEIGANAFGLLLLLLPSNLAWFFRAKNKRTNVFLSLHFHLILSCVLVCEFVFRFLFPFDSGIRTRRGSERERERDRETESDKDQMAKREIFSYPYTSVAAAAAAATVIRCNRVLCKVKSSLSLSFSLARVLCVSGMLRIHH